MRGPPAFRRRGREDGGVRQLGRRGAPAAAPVRAAATFCLVLLAALSAAHAADKPAGGVPELPPRVETRHTLTIAGRSLDYRAIAETIGLVDPKGDSTASIFTISYLVEPPAGAQRPVAFAFNGGPGAAAVFLHLGALGPRILDTPASGAVPEPPVALADNPASWLAFSDLVFVDPVGTGFSRGNGKDDNPDKPFWDVHRDLDSLGALVRRWLTRHQRWGAPVYLVGESYGGLRAAALARTLDRDVGVIVSGLVLVSPALDIAVLRPDISNPLAPAFALPSFAAAKAALQASAPASPAAAAAGEKAEVFALGDYLVGLAGMKGVPSEGDAFIARVAEVTGLSAEIVRRERGRIGGQTFAHELRRSQGQILSVYDATVTRAAAANPWSDHAGDPVLDASVAAYTTAFERYAQEELGYHTERPYRVLWREASQHWNWDGARGEGGLGIALASLQETLLAHPATRLLVVNGRYDLVTPYLSSRWLVDQLAVPAAVRADLRLRVYEGGHMMYMRPAARAAFAADAAELFGSEGAGSALPAR